MLECLQKKRNLKTKTKGDKTKRNEMHYHFPHVKLPSSISKFEGIMFSQAGLVCRDHPEQLVIALEPEAAAISCTERKMDAILSEKLDVSMDGLLSQLNAQYMVVDIGGKVTENHELNILLKS